MCVCEAVCACDRDIFVYMYDQIGRRQWYPTPALSLGKSYGRRSLVGCRPWGLEESDTTERLHFHFSLSCIGEGNGNPLQCPCVSVIYALIDINACMMHSCSYCHKQKVNHACVAGLLFQGGKDDNCPFMYSQGLPSSSIWFTYNTMTQVPPERKCKEAKVFSMLFTFL